MWPDTLRALVGFVGGWSLAAWLLRVALGSERAKSVLIPKYVGGLFGLAVAMGIPFFGIGGSGRERG